MTEFRAGDWVKVTLDRAMVQADATDGYLFVNVGCDEIRLGLNEEGVTVEHVAPANWPPQSGDRWRDVEKDAWVAVYDCDKDRVVLIVTRTGAVLEPDEVVAKYSPLTLEHREGADDA